MFEIYNEYVNRWKDSAKRHFENHKAVNYPGLKHLGLKESFCKL